MPHQGAAMSVERVVELCSCFSQSACSRLFPLVPRMFLYPRERVDWLVWFGAHEQTGVAVMQGCAGLCREGREGEGGLSGLHVSCVRARIRARYPLYGKPSLTLPTLPVFRACPAFLESSALV